MFLLVFFFSEIKLSWSVRWWTVHCLCPLRGIQQCFLCECITSPHVPQKACKSISFRFLSRRFFFSITSHRTCGRSVSVGECDAGCAVTASLCICSMRIGNALVALIRWFFTTLLAVSCWCWLTSNPPMWSSQNLDIGCTSASSRWARPSCSKYMETGWWTLK